MSAFKPWAVLAILFTILSACAGTKAADNSRDWHIQYTISGGIAGVRQELNLQQDGHYRVNDKKRQISKELIASPAQLMRLHEQIRLIANTANRQNDKLSLPGRCADCITQSIVIDYKSRKIRYISRHGTVRIPAYHVLLTELSAMLKQGLGSRPD